MSNRFRFTSDSIVRSVFKGRYIVGIYKEEATVLLQQNSI
jgi:hypothetical protein